MTKKKRYKIGIAVHAFNYVHFDVYFNHLYCIGKWAHKYDLVYIGKSGLQAATARESIIRHAKEQECEYVFFMDADHLFHVDALDLLMESKDEAMVSGLVCKKGEEYQQVGWGKTEREGYLAVDFPLEGKTYEVAACAFGCTLINMEKLQKLEEPYFRDTFDEEHKCNIRSDINISDMFRKIGEKVWIDSRVLIGHHGIIDTVYPQNSKSFHKLRVLLAENVKLKEGQQGVYYVS